MDPKIQQFFYTKALGPSGKNIEEKRPPSRVLLSLTSNGRKTKELNVMKED